MNGTPAVPPFERHYTVKELAERFHLAQSTVRALFADEPGVLRVEHALRKGRTRGYTTLRVPESIALRVHRKLTSA